MISEAAAARLAHLPHIKRARGFRLYAPQERRILDLYQDGGRAMLGHRPGKLIHDVKNVLERGVLSPFPSPETYRVQKVVASLLEHTMPRGVWDKPLTHEHVALYPSLEAALAALRGAGAPVRLWDPVAVPRAGGASTPGPVNEAPHGASNTPGPANEAPHGASGTPGPVNEAPAAGDAARRDVRLWRPELPEAVWTRHGHAHVEAVIVLLPLPSTFSVVPVVSRDPLGKPCAPLPEPSLRAATLVAHMTMQLEQRPGVFLPGFEVVGPYLTMVDADKIDETTYEQRFLRFLERDILISPERHYPSIYPRELSDGERKRLERAAREIIGGEHGQ